MKTILLIMIVEEIKTGQTLHGIIFYFVDENVIVARDIKYNIFKKIIV